MFKILKDSLCVHISVTQFLQKCFDWEPEEHKERISLLYYYLF